MKKSDTPLGNLFFALATTCLLIAANLSAHGATNRTDDNTQPLADDWMIQSAAEAKSGGADISAPKFATTGWHAASVPTTVLAALVQDGT